MLSLEKPDAVRQFDLFFEAREKPRYHAALGIRLWLMAAKRGWRADAIGSAAGVERSTAERLVGGIFVDEDGARCLLDRIAAALGARFGDIARESGRVADIKNAAMNHSDPGYGMLVNEVKRHQSNNPKAFAGAMALGAGIREFREAVVPIGRRMLSERSGVNEMYISLLEHGCVPERALDSRIEDLARALRVNREEVRSRGEEMIRGIAARCPTRDPERIMGEVRNLCRSGIANWRR